MEQIKNSASVHSPPPHLPITFLPYGYRRIGDAGVPPKIASEEAAVVEQVFERYATELSSYQGIADWLNEQGHRTRAGRRFSKDTMAEMLTNPLYKGRVAHRQGKGESCEGQHEFIASEDLWRAAGLARGHCEQARPSSTRGSRCRR